MMARWILGGLLAAGIGLGAGRAAADEPKAPAGAPGTMGETPKPPASVDERTAKGRAAFALGVQRSKDAQWGEALAAFEDAAAARDAPIVQYNIGFCQRALGRYVAARRTFRRVLANTEGLGPTQIEDSKTFAAEMDQLVVRVAITLDPADAPLVVDGRPLRAATDGGATVYVTLPGPNAGAPGKAFTVELDPGVHLFRASRAGHQDAFVQKSYRPGEKAALDLHLDLLPAQVAVRAEAVTMGGDSPNPSGRPFQAIVRVDDREVGLAPIDLERPPGKYKIEVLRDGFETYAATFDLHAGQRADLTAKLVPQKVSVLKKWWFWTAAAVVVAGGVAVTYALTRPAPPLDGGNLNWVANKPTAVRW